jgi:hypothetical protein
MAWRYCPRCPLSRVISPQVTRILVRQKFWVSNAPGKRAQRRRRPSPVLGRLADSSARPVCPGADHGRWAGSSAAMGRARLHDRASYNRAPVAFSDTCRAVDAEHSETGDTPPTVVGVSSVAFPTSCSSAEPSKNGLTRSRVSCCRIQGADIAVGGASRCDLDTAVGGIKDQFVVERAVRSPAACITAALRDKECSVEPADESAGSVESALLIGRRLLLRRSARGPARVRSTRATAVLSTSPSAGSREQRPSLSRPLASRYVERPRQAHA